MAHRGRSFRGRGISETQRRKKKWVNVLAPALSGSGVSTTQLTGNIRINLPVATPVSDVFSSSGAIVSTIDGDRFPSESTVLRIRGSLNLLKNAIPGTGEVIQFAFGIGVMEGTAADLGAFPNPATPEGGGWDGWMFFRSQQAGALDANAAIFDVKSMRKIQSGNVIFFVFGQHIVDVTGGVLPDTSSVNFEFNARSLIFLP